jgi:hypothetical protein
VHAYGLKPRGVAADAVHADAGRDLLVAIVEHHAITEYQPHHAADVVGLVGAGEAVVAHVAAGRERHLVVLHVEGRLRERVEGADVIVVEMGDDDVLDPGRIHVEPASAPRPACATASAPRFSAMSWLKPVSTTTTRPSPRITHR